MFPLVWVTKVIQDAYKNAYYHSSSLNPFNHSALCFLIRLPTTMPISVNCDVRFCSMCTCLPVSLVGRKKWPMVTSFSNTKLSSFTLAHLQIHQLAFFFFPHVFCRSVSTEDFFYFWKESRFSHYILNCNSNNVLKTLSFITRENRIYNKYRRLQICFKVSQMLNLCII